MMIGTLDTIAVHELWRKLTYELANVFDAHGVCATVAYKIAVHTNTTTVVGIRDPQNQYYDVWICNSYGDMQQARWRKEEAAFGPLIGENRAVWVEKFSRPASELINSELWQLPRDAILCVPLPFPRSSPTPTPPGLICLIDADENCCLTIDNLEPLSLNITTFLDRAYLQHQVNRQEVEFAVVSDISHALTSTLNLQEIFRQLQNQVRTTMNVETISVGLYEQETGDLLFVESLMGPLFVDLGPIRLKKGQGIGSWVAENRESLIINDVYADRRFYSQVDKRSGFETQSMICIPLQVEERIIGVLQAINKKTGHFNENDLRLLQALGGPLTAAIENAHLHADVLAKKRRIETMFASMAEGLLTVDKDGFVTQVNESLLTLIHQAEEDLVGANAYEVVSLEKGNLHDLTAQVLTTDEEYPQLAANLKQGNDEFVPVLISGTPIRDKDNRLEEIIFVFSDLRQIREVERMRDDFFHGIIHELRTPLATILMYARLLREGKAADDQTKTDRFLGVIERESDRLQKMVWQMLQMAKLEAREFQRSFEHVDLNELFDELLTPLADRATEKGLLFRQRITGDLPSVLGSKETYHMIFKNLVENAIKFTLSGGVKVTAWAEGNMVQVSVQDDGIGIPPEALPNLFRRFYRAQTAVERGIAGSGLGLYMVKEGVENYNGTIKVDSIVDKGTTFTIQLPIAA